MRLLHTSDWHLGRTIRGISRQSEFEAVVAQVVEIARDQKVDAVLLAGDTFDKFSPSADAERLFYEAMRQLLADGIKVVAIAGNHDHAERMDATAGVLRIAGMHCVGAVPAEENYSAIRLTSRTADEAATIVAVPWVPERLAVEYEKLFGSVEDTLARYSGQMERALRYFCGAFAADTANVLLGHMLIGDVEIGEVSANHRLHFGNAFAVQPSSLPDTAQYIALGHVHKLQQVPCGAPAFYAGSLLQLDFGEAQQEKFVQIVDVRAGAPAKYERVPVSGGRSLRNVTLKVDELESHRDRYGDDYLRVKVELEAPVISLYDAVRDVLPNALEVTALLPVAEGELPPRAADHRSVSPRELLMRFYAERHNGTLMPPELLNLFDELYRAEGERAPA